MDSSSKVFDGAQEKAVERQHVRQAAIDCAPFVMKHLLEPALKIAKDALVRNAYQGNLANPDVIGALQRGQGSIAALELLIGELELLQK